MDPTLGSKKGPAPMLGTKKKDLAHMVSTKKRPGLYGPHVGHQKKGLAHMLGTKNKA